MTISRGEREDIDPSSSSSVASQGEPNARSSSSLVSQGGSIDASIGAQQQSQPPQPLHDFAGPIDLEEHAVSRIEIPARVEGVRESELKGTRRILNIYILI